MLFMLFIEADRQITHFGIRSARFGPPVCRADESVGGAAQAGIGGDAMVLSNEKRKVSVSPAPPQVSIIVPTRNEEHNLPRLLRSIRSQVDVSFEILVVDQESDDATSGIARDHGAIVISRPKPAFYSPPSQSRNVGAAAAVSPILLHIDADMELPDAGFLYRALALIGEDHQAAIIHESDVANGWWNRVKAAERDCYWDTPMECARIVTKKLFDEIGGYDANISSGEDMYIHQLYSQRTRVAKAGDVWLKHHTGTIPLKRLLAKKFSYGKTMSDYLDRSGESGGHSGTSWMRESLRAYASHLNIARQKPLTFACIVPLRFMELIAMRLGARSAARG